MVKYIKNLFTTFRDNFANANIDSRTFFSYSTSSNKLRLSSARASIFEWWAGQASYISVLKDVMKNVNFSNAINKIY